MDSFSEIGVFTKVVELGSFTLAGRRLGLTPSGVSRVLSRLEARLGVRLLHRTTRSLSLTADGAEYFERCARLVRDLEEADRALAQSRGVPRGRLRVDVPVVLGEHVFGPAVPKFLAAHPELSLDLSVRDQLIDAAAEGIDVVVRLAQVKDQGLVQRRLGLARRVLVASPKYLERKGRPRSLESLSKHECLAYLSQGLPLPWQFRGEKTVHVSGRFHVSSGAVLREAALAGLGISQTFTPHVQEALDKGRLVTVLDEFEPAPRPVWALFSRGAASQPKVRVFLEFAAALLGG